MAFITPTELTLKEPAQQQLLAAPRCRNAQAANFHPYKWPLCSSEGGQTANQEHTQFQPPKNQTAGSNSSSTLSQQSQQTVPGAAPPVPVQATWVACSCHVATHPGFASKPEAKGLEEFKADRGFSPGLSGSSAATLESDHVPPKPKAAQKWSFDKSLRYSKSKRQLPKYLFSNSEPLAYSFRS